MREQGVPEEVCTLMGTGNKRYFEGEQRNRKNRQNRKAYKEQETTSNSALILSRARV